MVVQNQSITFVSGDFHNVSITVTNLDGGGPLDLTGKTVSFEAGNGVVSKNSAQGSASIDVTSAVNGQFTIKLKSSDTAGLTQNLPFSVKVIESDGNYVTVATGMLVLLPIS